MVHAYENKFLLLILLLTIFFSWRSFAQIDQKPNNIKKIFHHRGLPESLVQLDSGSLVLYFDRVPTIVPSARVDIEDNREVQTFFLPSVMLRGEECKRIAQLINKNNEGSYRISIMPVNVPSQGTSIVISYSKGEHSVACKKFDQAVGNNKGLIFYVYNQKVLDALAKKEEPLIQMASLSHDSPCIFIDYGHGGSDTGAIGCGSVKEKNICLSIGTHLAQMLKKKGYRVALSRSTDCDIALDQRTTMANKVQADMLISIHANSAANPLAHGVETFCIVPSLLKHVYGTVNKELIPTADRVLMQRSKKSYELALSVQKELCSAVASYQKSGFDRGVKHNVAQVFFAQMPAILVELGFLTNIQESHLLTTKHYQYLLAQALCRGISENFQLN